MDTVQPHSAVDVEECVRQVGGSKFDLILIAAARMRELKAQRKESGVHTRNSEVLIEIQEGRINAKEYLMKVK